jgi:hypothetical protein
VTVTVFGIRHHGPGSARSLVEALAALEPDAILIEGPPEGNDLLPQAAEEGMQPPVALLVYRPDLPRWAAFYPFAVFSPEWQAIQFGIRRGIPVRFCDLPQAVQLAAVEEEDGGAVTPPGEPDTVAERVRRDPIGALVLAAGYEDSELWWEEQVERRADARGLYDAILEAMDALRADLDGPDEREARREAHMRQALRRAEKEGFQRIAAVCGAWHAPALRAHHPVKNDTALLAGLKRVRVDATWIPWSNFRLSYGSGYGAGVESPGWYGHLWDGSTNATIGWLAKAAQLLRRQGLDAPASGVIDATRLGDALAALRDRRNPGLQELRESIRAVLCAGSDAPMQTIRHQLEVGDLMGAVPASVRRVPLQMDVERQQRHVRLRPDETSRVLDLDLRRDLDRERSVLLHRLLLLGIPWGSPHESRPWTSRGSRGGTFHEIWRLQWQVEFVLLVIERNIWGNTLADAAAAFIEREAEPAELPRLTELLHSATLADLPGAVTRLLDYVQARAAVATDVRHLLGAVPPLAQIIRYGDVRGTTADHILPIATGLFERALIGLPGACANLDDASAADMVNVMARVDESLRLLNTGEMDTEWRDLLRQFSEREGIHMMVRGWCCRRALDGHTIDGDDLARIARLALSPAGTASDAAAWLEGLLRGSGLGLLQQEGLWLALDTWLQSLDPDTFTSTLPLLRRAFSGFHGPERRAMGEKVKRLRGDASEAGQRADADAVMSIDRERARQVLPVLEHILGGVDGSR